jgi:hypothetical protein
MPEAAGQTEDRQRRRRPWRRRLVGLALAAVAVALAAEATVVLVLGVQPKCPRHVVEAPWGLRINDPGSRYGHSSPDGEWDFRINAQGMRRDEDVAWVKPPGTLRVLSLGDSFTIGYEVQVEQCFSSVLEQQLQAEGLQVQVLNVGMSGSSPAEQLLSYERAWHEYEPDLVLVSFFANDLADNLRTGLFGLEGDELVPLAERYVPAGGLGNFLNQNPVFNWFGEHSDAFAYLKQQATLLLKGESHEENVERAKQVAAAQGDGGGSAGKEVSGEQRLCAAIYDRLYEQLHAQGIPLVIQSIPSHLGGEEPQLLDWFPYDAFDGDRPGLFLLPTKPLLDPHLERELLYHQRTYSHWTPFAHDVSGRALAALVKQEGLLD